jgi:FlaA1/EpsC-like NDP-sugar epimerase
VTALINKRVLITGATGEIGAAIARKLHEGLPALLDCYKRKCFESIDMRIRFKRTISLLGFNEC